LLRMPDSKTGAQNVPLGKPACASTIFAIASLQPAVARGVSLFMIGKMLGHKDSRTTEIYAHLGDDPLKRAANATANTLADLLSKPPQVALGVPARELLAAE